jgi:hypothetical protein
MSTLVLEKTESGVHLDPEQLRQAGFEPGIPMQLVQLPGSESIINRALAHVIRRLGEGLGVGDPEWTGSEWRIDVLAPGGEHTLGHLYLDAFGTVDTNRSLSYEQLLEIADAARPAGKAAA